MDGGSAEFSAAAPNRVTAMKTGYDLLVAARNVFISLVRLLMNRVNKQMVRGGSVTKGR